MIAALDKIEQVIERLNVGQRGLYGIGVALFVFFGGAHLLQQQWSEAAAWLVSGIWCFNALQGHMAAQRERDARSMMCELANIPNHTIVVIEYEGRFVAGKYVRTTGR